MSLRLILIPTLCAVAALTAACDGDKSVRITSSHSSDEDAKGVLKVVDALQCPQTIGSLTRKGSASSEGTVCKYVGPRGAEVILQLVPLNDQKPSDVLQAFETRLSADLPQAVAGLRASAEADKARAEADRARATADGARAEAEVAAQEAEAAARSGDRASVRAPGVNIEAEGDDATVRLPGMHIETRGDQASVRIGGFHIDANDSTGTVDIEGGENGDSVSVRARDDSAEVRASASGDATRASWILTDNRPSPEGWRMVGYEARGPVGGPLVIATIRSRDRNRDSVTEDAKALVSLNVGE
ncbi:methyltransferase type 11 [Brevundimonas lenta]|uniref:Methyltransferase type 11 n=1 Tax=Brevundimonas lenta TaxID=424796 RepID=A0A7W6NPN7_9CAUL|nr:methyltransferase type 11 [Brevundimonas lenta]MBB4083595.1 hypothetical protein [Brevundimonas lenta]